MRYHSTRNLGHYKTFDEVLVSTYAPDGGLYVPEKVPLLTSSQFCEMKNLTFPEVCAEILHLYSGIDRNDLNSMASASFMLFNDGNQPLPLTKLPVDGSSIYLLDTSLGPTFAFKDIGQQMVGKLLNYVLGKQNKKAKIVVETSGDTGPAAITGVLGCKNVEIFCLYPQGRVSEIQELQMITILDENVHVYRTQGDTDEQASVLKELFQDENFVQQHHICSVNSINWVRIATQSSYYVWSYLKLCQENVITFGDPIDYVIPTGAFGNAMGAYLARLMGLPIRRIFCATNANDIVHRTLTTGDMSMGTNIQTESPAMDIQFAYNLERMLYFISNENPEIVRTYMAAVEQQYSYLPGAKGAQLDSIILTRIQSIFTSYSVSNKDTLDTINNIKLKYNILLCPHSATGVYAALNPFQELLLKSNPSICVLTAHPAKFEETIYRATGQNPILPNAIAELRNKPVKYSCLNKTQQVHEREQGQGDESKDIELRMEEQQQKEWRQEWIAQLKHDIENC